MARGPQGIRGIRQTIPSGFAIGRSSPGATKGQPGLVPLPSANQQAIISGAGGKPTSGGAGMAGFGTTGVASSSSVAAGPGITIGVAGAVYTVSLTNPITVPLIFAEQTTPATPAAGTYVLYMDSADHKLKCKNSAGAVTILGP